jgi:geranylgeranyl pyrophosphate synthase
VFAAITGKQAPVRLASALWLLYVGVELCDDVADGDIRGGAAAEVQAMLVAGTVLSSIAPQAIASLLPAPEALEALEYLWRGGQAMSGGQRRDLALFGDLYPEPREAEAALAKSTAECGMYAAISACVAGERGAVVARWEQFGAEMGYALEVNADCRDALEPSGRDIAAGARTLPIALALQVGAHSVRDELRSDLAAAARESDACERARRAILASGSLKARGTLVEAAIIRAGRILKQIAPPYDAGLRKFLTGTSFLRPV